MGCEFAQWREWNHDAGLDWFLLDNPMNKGMQTLLCDLNAAYRTVPALHVKDVEPAGFRWVIMDDAEQSVYAYLRLGRDGDPPALVVCNFTPLPRFGYRIGVPQAGFWREAVNSDAGIYGGSNLGNNGGVQAHHHGCHDLPASLELTLPPLSTIILVFSA
jgi:1,4-alpha-glucan branching enzyme